MMAPTHFSESLLSGAAEAHQQKLHRTNKILSREKFNDTKNSEQMVITDQPMVKMDEARVLKSSKLTFMVILIVWLILTVIVIGKCLTYIICSLEINMIFELAYDT